MEQVALTCGTRNEFDLAYSVWLINPEDHEDYIDVVFEDDELAPCLAFCEKNSYEIRESDFSIEEHLSRRNWR